jgi:AAA+ superfamily predicted ATPase
MSGNWHEANQQHLMRAIAEVRSGLEEFLVRSDGKEIVPEVMAQEPLPEMTAPLALEMLCSAFELSSFERKVLLMCAGTEMDSRFASLFAQVRKEFRPTQPTFSLALAAFADAHWSALSPGRPLRYWNLLEISSGETLTTCPLRIQERVLHYLAGVPCLDERLLPILKPVAAEQTAVSHRNIVEEIAAIWSQAHTGRLPIVSLCGDEIVAKRAIAAHAAAAVGVQLHSISLWNLPHGGAELTALLRLWEREAVLSSSALLLECDESDGADAFPHSAIVYLMDSIRSPLIISSRTPRKSSNRVMVTFDVGKPTAGEQEQMWRSALNGSFGSFANLNGHVEPLVSQFSLSSSTIRSVATQALKGLAVKEEPDASQLSSRLWDACRIQARPRLDGLAQRIEACAQWDDLVLHERQKQILREIAVHVRQRARVYQDWGFATKGMRGLGISALFAGASGTGKTMAAEVLADELRLDLYRIDLSQVVSKYIGETEKNLRRVFDAAEEGAAILLFDEADALFGKRTEVKDSHDRYANIEVSYLLQRMEAYRGLAILTTNRKSALDQAFLRRIRFVVEFPFPEAPERVEIWRRVFPASTPTEGLRLDRLARLTAAGGHIRNIALGAAFLAADAGEPVRMAHLLSAARSEFAKLEKPLTDVEIAGWV